MLTGGFGDKSGIPEAEPGGKGGKGMIGRFSFASSSSSLQDHVEEHDRKATQPTVNAETAKKQLFAKRC
jgi:hypothetical protein